MRTDVPVIHFGDVEGTSTGSSCSDAIVAFAWIGKFAAIPRRCACFSLRVRERALIQKLDEIFCKQNI